MSIITLGISDNMSKQCVVIIGRNRIPTQTTFYNNVEYYLIGGFDVENASVVDVFMPRIARWMTTHQATDYSISIAAIQHYDIIKHIIHNVVYKHTAYTLFGKISARRELAPTIRAKSWRRKDDFAAPARPLTIKKRITVDKNRIDLSRCSYIIVGNTTCCDQSYIKK